MGNAALGDLLENIVAHLRDVTVIAWTVKSIPVFYNSALPASLAIYSQMPHSPPTLSVNELDMQVEQLHAQVPSEDAGALYNQVVQLPHATFSN